MTEHTQLQVGFEMKHSEGYYRILQGLRLLLLTGDDNGYLETAFLA